MKQEHFFRAIAAVTMMLVSSLPSLAFDFEADGIYYNITSYEAPYTAEVTQNYFLYFGDIVIPGIVTYNEVAYSVTSIGKSAFWSCRGLTSVEITSSITSIEENAFRGRIGLTIIEIPNSVTSIENYTFRDCSGLTSVVWNAVNCQDFTSSSAPFSHCLMASFTFGESVEHIPAYLCSGMSNLTGITIPNSVTSIGSSVFSNKAFIEVHIIFHLANAIYQDFYLNL